jgi:hypothetical protein
MLTVGELLERINEALDRGDVERENAVKVMLSGDGGENFTWLDAGVTGCDPEEGFFITVLTGEPPPVE